MNNVISTGFQELDDALKGGLHRGSITMCYGTKASGKTALAMSIALHASKTHKVSYAIDPSDKITKRDILFERNVCVNSATEYIIKTLLLPENDLLIIDNWFDMPINNKLKKEFNELAIKHDCAILFTCNVSKSPLEAITINTTYPEDIFQLMGKHTQGVEPVRNKSYKRRKYESIKKSIPFENIFYSVVLTLDKMEDNCNTLVCHIEKNRYFDDEVTIRIPLDINALFTR